MEERETTNNNNNNNGGTPITNQDLEHLQSAATDENEVENVFSQKNQEVKHPSSNSVDKEQPQLNEGAAPVFSHGGRPSELFSKIDMEEN